MTLDSAESFDYERSLKRVLDAEERREKETGFGTTKQGCGLVLRHLQPLTDKIASDWRRGGRDRDIWKILKAIDNHNLAFRLLVSAISVCCLDEISADPDSENQFRDQVLRIGLDLIERQPVAARHRLGVWGINLLLDLPIFAMVDGALTLLVTDGVTDLWADTVARAVVGHPLLSPRFVAPEPWTQVRRGALPSSHWARLSLVGHTHPSVENALRYAISRGQMRPALNAISSLQATRFAINKPLLDWVEKHQAPPSPDASSSRKRRREAIVKREAFELDMTIARWCADQGLFFVMLRFDFRGRIYGIPHFNFQREDHVRGLITFADAEPIGAEGTLSLKAHVAAKADGNGWSDTKKPNKLNFEKRVAWTDDNIEQIRRIAEAVRRGAPISGLPEEPVQFLAACLELVEALDVGPSFRTRLPLTFDGSCNAMQHLCAMTRAPEGRLVNLTPSEDGEDFYGLIAQRVYDNYPELRYVMGNQPDRAIVKQPVMTYFYNSDSGGWSKKKGSRKLKPHGMTAQIVAVLKGKGKSPKEAKRLAEAICATLEGVVPSATALREFLKDIVRLCAEQNKPLRWTTPLGFPVINAYYKPKKQVISTTVKGRRRTVTLIVGDTGKIDLRRSVNAVTANFIHSADAAHLHMIANAAAAAGIPMVAVHDSFACRAPDARRLNEIIREQFVALYEQNDMLADLLESARRDLPGVALPPLPQRGNLDLTQVLQSFFAFS